MSLLKSEKTQGERIVYTVSILATLQCRVIKRKTSRPDFTFTSDFLPCCVFGDVLQRATSSDKLSN